MKMYVNLLKLCIVYRTSRMVDKHLALTASKTQQSKPSECLYDTLLCVTFLWLVYDFRRIEISRLCPVDAEIRSGPTSAADRTRWRTTSTRNWRPERSTSLPCSRHALLAPSPSTCCWSKHHAIIISRGHRCRAPVREQVLCQRCFVFPSLY